MAGHILPVTFSWPLGSGLTSMAGSSTSALCAHKCSIAGERDVETTGAPFGAEYVWAMTDTALEALKRRVHSPRLDPDGPATKDEPKELKPVV